MLVAEKKLSMQEQAKLLMHSMMHALKDGSTVPAVYFADGKASLVLKNPDKIFGGSSSPEWGVHVMARASSDSVDYDCVKIAYIGVIRSSFLGPQGDLVLDTDGAEINSSDEQYYDRYPMENLAQQARGMYFVNNKSKTFLRATKASVSNASYALKLEDIDPMSGTFNKRSDGRNHENSLLSRALASIRNQMNRTIVEAAISNKIKEAQFYKVFVTKKGQFNHEMTLDLLSNDSSARNVSLLGKMPFYGTETEDGHSNASVSATTRAIFTKGRSTPSLVGNNMKRPLAEIETDSSIDPAMRSRAAMYYDELSSLHVPIHGDQLIGLFDMLNIKSKSHITGLQLYNLYHAKSYISVEGGLPLAVAIMNEKDTIEFTGPPVYIDGKRATPQQLVTLNTFPAYAAVVVVKYATYAWRNDKAGNGVSVSSYIHAVHPVFPVNCDALTRAKTEAIDETSIADLSYACGISENMLANGVVSAIEADLTSKEASAAGNDSTVTAEQSRDFVQDSDDDMFAEMEIPATPPPKRRCEEPPSAPKAKRHRKIVIDDDV